MCVRVCSRWRGGRTEKIAADRVVVDAAHEKKENRRGGGEKTPLVARYTSSRHVRHWLRRLSEQLTRVLRDLFVFGFIENFRRLVLATRKFLANFQSRIFSQFREFECVFGFVITKFGSR